MNAFIWSPSITKWKDSLRLQELQFSSIWMSLRNKEDMRNKFEKIKAPKRGKLAELFFDEVKIKEGLVFDSSSCELIGFKDIIAEN